VAIPSLVVVRAALFCAVLLPFAPGAFARGRATPEQAQAVGQPIAAALNAGNAHALMGLIDVQTLQRNLATELGLNPAQAAQLQEGMLTGLRRNIEVGLNAFAQKDGFAKFIRAGRRDGKPYSLVRIEHRADDSEAQEFRAFSRALAARDMPGAYRALDDLPAAYKQTKDWARTPPPIS